jgi:parallel beta-helix repeat protein
MTSAIEIINSNVHFIVRNCTFLNSGPYDAGINLENVYNGTLYENNCSINYKGINFGIDCDFNNVIGNIVNNNDKAGIYLDDECDNNTISQNIASNNSGTGIFLYGGERGGIECSYNNTFLENKVHENNYGIQLEGDCYFNVFSGNIIKNNNFGIQFDSSCSNNSVFENFFIKNGKHAIDDGTENTWNSSSIGNYWDNHTGPDLDPNNDIVDLPYNISGTTGSRDYLPIAEDGAPIITIISPVTDDLFGITAPSFDVTITDDYLESMWYTIDGGLNNYTFTENGMIDQSAWGDKSDGTITLAFFARDIPENINSAEVSIIKDATAPIIVINSPIDGDEFGNQAPLFNITVTDDHLDSIWYSFDGGLTTYAITNNTLLNQTVWTALSQGNVTITFYAIDLLGNEASESVTVVKNVPSGLDPGVTITIVVVSVVGGVVVIAGVYIFMKKRV